MCGPGRASPWTALWAGNPSIVIDRLRRRLQAAEGVSRVTQPVRVASSHSLDRLLLAVPLLSICTLFQQLPETGGGLLAFSGTFRPQRPSHVVRGPGACCQLPFDEDEEPVTGLTAGLCTWARPWRRSDAQREELVPESLVLRQGAPHAATAEFT